MASRKKTENSEKGSRKPQGKSRTDPEPEIKARNKGDELAQAICRLADSGGYFDPRDVYAQVRKTDLEKRASVIISNLRLQGFGKDDRLRIPVSEGPDGVKKFITLTARLRKEKADISFEDAVGLLRSGNPFRKSSSEPRLEPVVSQPDTAADLDMPTSPRTEKNYKALYKEARENVLKLRGELAAYKEMCSLLMENLKK
jgi:hypothetical protein